MLCITNSVSCNAGSEPPARSGPPDFGGSSSNNVRPECYVALSTQRACFAAFPSIQPWTSRDKNPAVGARRRALTPAATRGCPGLWTKSAERSGANRKAGVPGPGHGRASSTRQRATVRKPICRRQSWQDQRAESCPSRIHGWDRDDDQPLILSSLECDKTNSLSCNARSVTRNDQGPTPTEQHAGFDPRAPEIRCVVSSKRMLVCLAA